MNQRNRNQKSVLTFIGFLLFLFLFGSVLAQESRQSEIERFDAYVEKARKAWQVPGMAVAIIQDGKTLLSKGYGVRDLEKGGEVDEHTLFAIASNSKAFTVAALAMLVDEEKIDWDDRVISYLPYFQLYDPYVTYEMRVRDLLCHRSGLKTYGGDLLWYGTPYSAEEVVRRARFLQPVSSFRTKYGYSNIMYITAGQIIPAVSGLTWQQFIKKRILDRITMTRTITSVKELGKMTNVATPHRRLGDEIVILDWYNWDAMAAAGGIISSVHDMAQWIRLQLNHGVWEGDTLFSKESSDEMWQAQLPLKVRESESRRHPSTHFNAYGLGWRLFDYLGEKVITHSGGYDGMYSRVVMVPEKNLGMVVLTNSMTDIHSAMMYQMLDTFLGEEDSDWSAVLLGRSEYVRNNNIKKRQERELKRVKGTNPSFKLKTYTGRYGGEMYGDAQISIEDDHLVLKMLPATDLTGDLSHWQHDVFKITWRKRFAWFDEGYLQFIMNTEGEIVEFKLDVPNDDFWFDELEFKKK